MKATAQAPANIAFIKYWGKADPITRVPANDSTSMNLSRMVTETTVEFLPAYKHDEVSFIGEEIVTEKERGRIGNALDKIRTRTRVGTYAKVMTRNNFPKATGIASSASGFASLALAAFKALDYQINKIELSKFCRTLSGTACRSIPDGFSEWRRGVGPDDSYAVELFPPDYWDICDVIAIVSKTMKKVGSTEGHAIADTSPFYKARMRGMVAKEKQLKLTMQERSFSRFGRIIEDEALNMHAICLTSTPPLIYWEPATIVIMKNIIDWREAGIVESYFTIDAGPTVHVICEGKSALIVAGLLEKIAGIERIVINYPTKGASIINNHLF